MGANHAGVTPTGSINVAGGVNQVQSVQVHFFGELTIIVKLRVLRFRVPLGRLVQPLGRDTQSQR